MFCPPCREGLRALPFPLCSYLVTKTYFITSIIMNKSLIAFFILRCYYQLVTTYWYPYYTHYHLFVAIGVSYQSLKFRVVVCNWLACNNLRRLDLQDLSAEVQNDYCMRKLVTSI